MGAQSMSLACFTIGGDDDVTSNMFCEAGVEHVGPVDQGGVCSVLAAPVELPSRTPVASDKPILSLPPQPMGMLFVCGNA